MTPNERIGPMTAAGIKTSRSIGDYMASLMASAKENREMKNFINHHHIDRVLPNGVPVWRRLPSWYERGKRGSMLRRSASVPGGVRRHG